MRHEWFDEEGHRRIIYEEGDILLRSFGEGIYSQVLSTESAAFAREILRLTERVRELEATASHERRRIAVRDARVAAQVAEAEGRLATLAEENRALRSRAEAAEITAEEGQEIIAELTAALAVRVGESLTPCAGGCPGHLGTKASAAARESLDRWTALEEENARVKGVLEAIRKAVTAIGTAEDRLRAVHFLLPLANSSAHPVTPG